MTAVREPMYAFAGALDVAAEAVRIQKEGVIAAAVVLAAAVVAEQGEPLVTFGLAEGELPLEVEVARTAIKFALQELEMKLLTVLIDHASQEITDHLNGTIRKLLLGGLEVAGESCSLKTDTKSMRSLAATIKTHAGHTERVSSQAHRPSTNRRLETESRGGRWPVAQVVETALLSIAEDIFRKLPGTLQQVMEETEQHLTQGAERLEHDDARLAQDAAELDGGAPGIPPAGSAPLALPAGSPLTRTLAQVRAMKDVRRRWEAGEQYAREAHGGGAEQHFPVPPNSDPDFPVTATGGRKVDCPIVHPDGSVTAVEVKMYGKYRTVTVADGSSIVHQVEVPLSPHIREQINKDVALARRHPGYDPRWEFLGAGPSQELRDHLTNAKIIFVEHH